MELDKYAKSGMYSLSKMMEQSQSSDNFCCSNSTVKKGHETKIFQIEWLALNSDTG